MFLDRTSRPQPVGVSFYEGQVEKMAKVLVNCETCGIEFLTPASEIRRGRGRFCSKKCYGKWLSKIKDRKLEKRCSQCGKLFKVKRSRYKIRKFCSIKCCNDSKGVLLTCQYCSKGFKAPPSKGSIRKYCSWECRILAIAVKKYRKVCMHCGKVYFVYKRDEAGTQFCSKECKIKASDIILNCLYCGKQIHVTPSLASKTKYCSKKCMGLDYKKRQVGKQNPNFRDAGHKKCLQCGEVYHSYIKTRKYCSQVCYHKASARSKLVNLERIGGHKYKGGMRDDLGIYVRSAWEANYARYLNWLVSIGEIKEWQYEPDTFEFTGVKKGTRFYTPDFKITNLDNSIEYHEVKGYMDSRSKTKLKRMAKYYPGIKLIVIDGKAYSALAKDVKRLIPEWE